MDDDAIDRKKQECFDFMDDIIRMARARKIPPRLLVRLFGLISRYLVDDNLLDKNHTRAEATQAVMDLFSEGLNTRPELSLAVRPDNHKDH